tara:strand:- start:2898 stop:3956 length:1059 start_codon:yes stop_codon:yes gene_type:complete
MILTEGDAVYAANKFIDYYTQFNRIDDYLRFVKKDRVSERSGSLFDADIEFFDSFDMAPNDMNFKVHVVDTNPKTTSRYNQWLYSETLNLTASNAIEEAIPGRTHKWIVVETNTNKVVGVVRFGSPTINSKPRNEYFGEVLPLSDINAHFVMGFNIVPTQPFGFNYLGGKLLALLACSKELKQQFDEKYGTDLKYFETTSLYGTTKGVSMYDGLKPFLRHIGDTESNFLPLFHDDEFRDFFWWFNERNGGERLISADKSSKKLKIQTKMISIIRNSLKNAEKLKEFNGCIDHAKSLTEKKRYYFGKFEHTMDEAITWWKKKATKRYEKLLSQDRIRTELEVWKHGTDLEIIR